MSDVLDLAGPLPSGRLVVEASAGTGKTYALSALFVRHLARGVSPSSILLVTFTRATAADLRGRTRQALSAAVAALEVGAPPAGHEWMSVLFDDVERSSTHLRRALTAFDDATITTIHGFCQLALRQLGLRAGVSLDGVLDESGELVIDEVCRDLLVAALISDAHALSWTNDKGVMASPSAVLDELVRCVRTILTNPAATVVPPKGPLEGRVAVWVDLVARAVAEVGRRRHALGGHGYDDMISGLHRAVTHPETGSAAVSVLRNRYHLAMVDEFQDTDPLQWEIFDAIFADVLVTVGDPKQAIYGFRGADVHAYLRATDPEVFDRHPGQRVHLSSNYRSQPDLVRATGDLLDGVELGDRRIVADRVVAAASRPVLDLAPGAPLQIRVVPDDASLRGAKGGLLIDAIRGAILDDLAATVVDLLAHRPSDNGRVRVAPGDIAVLVPDRTRAEEVVRVLREAGVPTVRARTGSVFGSPAAGEWRRLLAALEQPSRPSLVRGATLGVFLQRSLAEVDPQGADGDAVVADLQRRCARWADQLARLPFLAWYDRVRAESGVVARLLARPDGERMLTDLDHLAELLAAASTSVGTSPAEVLRHLGQLARASSDTDTGPTMRRIDSDAAAVQVSTVHSSKGLEYPVVLLPFAFQTRSVSSPYVFSTAAGQRVIDIAAQFGWSGDDAWPDPDSHEQLAELERRGEALRLLYVGLTRAEQRTVVWWAPVDGSDGSALHRVLFGARDSVPTVDEARDVLDEIVRRSDHTIAVGMCRLGEPIRVWRGGDDGASPVSLAVADAGTRVVTDPTWRRWSFSSISRSAESVPVTGGLDEPEGVVDDMRAEMPDTSPPVAADRPAMHLAEVVAGTAFGTLVHAVLERVDPAAPTFVADLRREVDIQVSRDRLAVDVERLVDGLVAAAATPLGTSLGDVTLAEVGAAGRLAELDFDMALSATRVRAAAIGEVLQRTLDPADPQRPYAASLAAGRFDLDLGGFMQGSIDAVLRLTSDDSSGKFVVVDYKTNRLHAPSSPNPLAAYHPDLLPAAMAEHDYPLQALIYSVAVHRFLRWRLAGYDPARHLGGIAYLFVRGMIGPQTPEVGGRRFGVFSWQPPVATIVALDHLFATGEAG